MKNKRRAEGDSNLLYTMLVVVFLSMFFVLYRYPGVSFGFGAEYVGMIPSMILIIVAVYGVKNSEEGPGLMGSFVILGLGFAYMVAELNTRNILIPGILNASLTLPNLQLIIVVLSVVIGAVFSIH